MSAAAEAQISRQKSPPPTPSKARSDSQDKPWLTLPSTPALPDPDRSDRIPINGTSIFFALFGSGPPVLLLHGGLANSNYWGHQIEALAQEHSVIVTDTRGHGRSPVTSSAFSYALFAQDVVGLLDFLKIARTSIVGWSDGAITGLQLAMTKPDRVSRLFAFGANSSLDGMKPSGGSSHLFAQYAQRCKDEYTALSPQPAKWSQLLSGLRAMWHTQPNFSVQQLASIKLPVTISDGEYDEIIKRDHTERMARAILGARLVIQPAVSHFAMLQNPTGYNKALLEFLTA